jgi:hypothetical protein
MNTQTKLPEGMTEDEYDVLTERAFLRLSELGFSEKEQSLIMYVCWRNEAGQAPEDWDEIKGTIFAATADAQRIRNWLESAYTRRRREMAS